MNRTTKTDREALIARISSRVTLDWQGHIVDFARLTEQVMAEHGVSREQARNAITRVARRLRRP